MRSSFRSQFWLHISLTPPLARLDDAYIALHSARVVLSGHDPVFGVPALVGATSPAYVALLTAILGLGIAPETLRFDWRTRRGSSRLRRRLWYLGETAGLALVRRVVLVVVALGSGVVVLFNLTNSLETGWAIATLTFAIACARADRVIGVACAAGLLPFLRPDLAPAAAIVLAYAVRGRRRADQIRALAVAVAVAAPWLLWTRLDTGAWLTNTMQAKQLFFAEGCRPWIEKAATVMRATAVGLAQMFPLCLGVIALVPDRLGRCGSRRDRVECCRLLRWIPRRARAAILPIPDSDLRAVAVSWRRVEPSAHSAAGCRRRRDRRDRRPGHVWTQPERGFLEGHQGDRRMDRGVAAEVCRSAGARRGRHFGVHAPSSC